MVLMLGGRVNALLPPAAQAAVLSKRHALRGGRGFGRALLRALGKLERRPLGLARIAEELAIHPVEAMGRSEKAKTFRIANHDTGCLRRDFDNIGV